jgi:hypothetical protein
MCRSIDPNHISWFKLLYKWCISSGIILCKPWVELLLSWVHSTYLFIIYKWVFKTRILSHFKNKILILILKKNFSSVRDSWWQNIIYLTTIPIDTRMQWVDNLINTSVLLPHQIPMERTVPPLVVAQYKAQGNLQLQVHQWMKPYYYHSLFWMNPFSRVGW